MMLKVSNIISLKWELNISYNDINFFCKENGQIADQELYEGKFNLLI